jgi:outer membrane protein X
MKKIIAIIALLASTFAQAQEYKPFKVNVSVGYASPTGSARKGGFLFGIEPKYSVTSHLDLGLRLESAQMIRGVEPDNTYRTTSGLSSNFNSAILTGNYLFGPFGDSNFRPFVGAGVGLFYVSSGGSVSFEQSSTKGELFMADYNAIGGLFRVGIKVGHFVASIDYNAAPTHIYQLGSIEFTAKSSYTGFRVGFDLGGGRK